MKALTNLLLKISNWKILLILLILYFSFPAYFFKNATNEFKALVGHEMSPIDLTFRFSTKNTLQMVEEFGAAREYYAKTELTTDIAYPIVYAFLFGVILTMLYRGTKWLWVAALLPFLNMLLDFAENISIVYLLKTFPQQSVFVATLCEIFKTLKWITFVAILAFIIYGLIRKVAKRDAPIRK